MGLAVTTRRGLGDTTTELATKGGIETGLMTAAAVDPEPISKAILGIVAAITSLFSFGYNPQKLNDTAVTENVQIALHKIWYQLTGEDLGMNCTPGQCGAQHVAIFTTSQYPNVPDGPSGNPAADINVVIQSAQQIIGQGRGALVRSQSVADYDANTNYMLGLFNDVASARAADPLYQAGAGGVVTDVQNAFAQLGAGGSLLPWLAIGGAILWALA